MRMGYFHTRSRAAALKMAELSLKKKGSVITKFEIMGGEAEKWVVEPGIESDGQYYAIVIKIDQPEIISSKQQFLGFLKRWCKNSPYLPTLSNPAMGQRRGNHGLTLPLQHSVSFSVYRSLRNNALHPPATSICIEV